MCRSLFLCRLDENTSCTSNICNIRNHYSMSHSPRLWPLSLPAFCVLFIFCFRFSCPGNTRNAHFDYVHFDRVFIFYFRKETFSVLLSTTGQGYERAQFVKCESWINQASYMISRLFLSGRQVADRSPPSGATPHQQSLRVNTTKTWSNELAD